MYTLIREEFEAIVPHKELQLRMPRSKGDEFQLSVPSQTNVIDSTVLMFQRRISRFCRAYQLPPLNITLCLREALSNAIIHGNLEISSHLKEASWENFETLVREREAISEFARRKVTVRCEMSFKQIKFEIEDEGSGFNAGDVQQLLQQYRMQNPDPDPIDIAASGRGLLIIVSLMDQVFWNERGNCITMIKHLN